MVDWNFGVGAKRLKEEEERLRKEEEERLRKEEEERLRKEEEERRLSVLQSACLCFVPYFFLVIFSLC